MTLLCLSQIVFYNYIRKPKAASSAPSKKAKKAD